jgi:hypothetical protein
MVAAPSCPAFFEQRLAQAGVTADELLHLLDDASNSICWMNDLRPGSPRLIVHPPKQASPGSPVSRRAARPTDTAFLELIRPLLCRCSAIAGGIQQRALSTETPSFELAPSILILFERLPGRLLPVMLRTLALAMSLACEASLTDRAWQLLLVY